jgi:hypothetical protein
VCAALAAAEASGQSADDLLAGVVSGLEIGVRLARSLGHRHTERGWDVAGTAGHVAAAVAAARAARLQPAELGVAMGIAATQAAGLRAALGTPVGALHAAKAAMDGAAAACLARAGFDGPDEPIAGRRGLLALMTRGADPSVIGEGLGEAWQFAGTDRSLPAGDAAGLPGAERPGRASAPAALLEDQALQLVEYALHSEDGSLRSLLLWCSEAPRRQLSEDLDEPSHKI